MLWVLLANLYDRNGYHDTAAAAKVRSKSESSNKAACSHSLHVECRVPHVKGHVPSAEGAQSSDRVSALPQTCSVRAWLPQVMLGEASAAVARAAIELSLPSAEQAPLDMYVGKHFSWFAMLTVA